MATQQLPSHPNTLSRTRKVPSDDVVALPWQNTESEKTILLKPPTCPLLRQPRFITENWSPHNFWPKKKRSNLF